LTLLEFSPGTGPWVRACSTLAIEPPVISLTRGPRTEQYRPLSPLWMAFDAPRTLTRIQDAIRKLFEDEEHPGLYQFNLIVSTPTHSGRSTVVIRSPRLSHDMPLDVEASDRNTDAEYRHDDVEIDSIGSVRRVVKVGGRPWLGFFIQVPPPPAIAPIRLSPLRPPELIIRIVVSHARPYSELEARLAEEQRNGDAELTHVREESRRELTQLRTRLGLIGLGSFAALALGGWFIVARGLSPIRKLSDAVSRVSEKDFRLSVERDELSRELVPILARLTQTFDLLRQAFAREKQAVGDISHELRTPIASLLATIDVSLRKPRTSDQYRSTLEDCRGIARQLGQLVERIMTLATLDAGNARTSVVRTDAAELAAACATIIRPLAEAHGLSFALQTEGTLEFETDPDKLREVIMNLLHNAVEYNRPGGRVDLAVRRSGSDISFEVSDTGIGMPAGIREKIFERFFRADSSRHATGVHAGLGLAIVKEYIERLGGTIAVESTPDVGSTFRVTLPAAPAHPSENDDPTPSIEPARAFPRLRGEPAPTAS
jgi:two-component system, OmpR family, heavy metal sensor histidine kinase CusS